jgi:hypothetical protein
MQVTRKPAKAIHEEDVPRYRIRDESAKGKTGQDKASIIRFHTNERGRRFVILGGSAEFVTRIRKMLRMAEVSSK